MALKSLWRTVKAKHTYDYKNLLHLVLAILHVWWKFWLSAIHTAVFGRGFLFALAITLLFQNYSEILMIHLWIGHCTSASDDCWFFSFAANWDSTNWLWSPFLHSPCSDKLSVLVFCSIIRISLNRTAVLSKSKKLQLPYIFTPNSFGDKSFSISKNINWFRYFGGTPM